MRDYPFAITHGELLAERGIAVTAFIHVDYARAPQQHLAVSGDLEGRGEVEELCALDVVELLDLEGSGGGLIGVFFLAG